MGYLEEAEFVYSIHCGLMTWVIEMCGTILTSIPIEWYFWNKWLSDTKFFFKFQVTYKNYASLLIISSTN